MGTPDYLISAALTMILAQRLVRKMCIECKMVDENVNIKLLSSIGMSPEKSARAKIYKGKGCDKCNQSGYKGRMAIYEVLDISREIKQAILANVGTLELLALAKKIILEPCKKWVMIYYYQVIFPLLSIKEFF